MDMSSHAPAEHFFAEVERLIDWEQVAPLVDAIAARAKVEIPPAAVRMLLLARWYGLSEAALLEACQDRISFRRFLGLPLDDDSGDVALAEAYQRQVAHAPREAQSLVHAIEAQLLARGYAVKPGMWSDATVLKVAPVTGSGRSTGSLGETMVFQPGALADLLREDESVLVRGGAKVVATNPPYGTTPSAALEPPPPPELAPVRGVVEWPWGASIAIEERLKVGRDPAFSPLAGELAAYRHVSRRHAELSVCADGVWVRDLRSRNGTFIDDEELPRGQAHLVDRDARVRFGPYCVVQLRITS